jgi:hypothetical protein
MKRIALFISSLTIVVISGCSTGPSTAQRENMLKPNDNYNFFGIVKSEQGTFKRVPLTSMSGSSDEITTRDNYSGDSVTLLWGLITLSDY